MVGLCLLKFGEPEARDCKFFLYSGSGSPDGSTFVDDLMVSISNLELDLLLDTWISET